MNINEYNIKYKNRIENIACEMYINETLVFYISKNCYVKIQSINEECRLYFFSRN